jgi:hypothetical protein
MHGAFDHLSFAHLFPVPALSVVTCPVRALLACMSCVRVVVRVLLLRCPLTPAASCAARVLRHIYMFIGTDFHGKLSVDLAQTWHRLECVWTWHRLGPYHACMNICTIEFFLKCAVCHANLLVEHAVAWASNPLTHQWGVLPQWGAPLVNQFTLPSVALFTSRFSV